MSTLGHRTPAGGGEETLYIFHFTLKTCSFCYISYSFTLVFMLSSYWHLLCEDELRGGKCVLLIRTLKSIVLSGV